MNKSREYNTWMAMHARCYNPNHTHFDRYGGRGIHICPEWNRSNNILAFENFVRDMGPRPDGSCIERINNNAHYEPTNCRWATGREQSHNRSNNVSISAFGENKLLLDWVKDSRCQANVNTLRLRIKAGWQPERAISLPSRFIEEKAYCPCCSREYLRIKEWQRFCSRSCRRKTMGDRPLKDKALCVMRPVSERDK